MSEDKDPGSIRVLIVDDQRAMRSIVRQLLSQVGIEDVEEAANGEAALEIINQPTEDDPDVIICDLHMDKMDGMELLNKIRRDDSRTIPILILTGDSDKLVHSVTEQIGAVAVMTKPVSAQELLAEIEKAVGFSISN